MRMNKNVAPILFSLFILLAGCHKCHDPGNPACDNYDPCYGQTEVSAKFDILEVRFSDMFWIPYATDTCTPYQITFKAQTSGATYEWHIGSGTYTTQQVDLSFANVADGTIPVMLIVKKSANLKCFPSDDGVDTVTRNLYIRKNSCRVYGTYYGSFTDSPSYKFTIRIEKALPSPEWYHFAWSNGCSDSTMVLTYGWPIPQSPVSADYPCGIQYAGNRELIFNVQPPDSIGPTTHYYTHYNTCVAFLDSTYNNITIAIGGTKENPDGSNNHISFSKTYKGIKQ